MARFIGFLSSLALHLLLVGSAFWVFEHTSPPGAAQPVPEVLQVVELVAPPELKTTKEMPTYATEKEQRKRKIFDVLDRATLPHENYKPVKLISPHKVDTIAGDIRLGQTDVFFGTGYLKQGNEVRLSLRSLRAAEFVKEDFVGRYRLQGEDDVIEVQALDDGRLLFIDHASGMRRILKKTGKFIYTYGPSFDEQEPVAGSLTFLPHERKALDLPSRIMWLPEKPPMKIGAMEDWPEFTGEEGRL